MFTGLAVCCSNVTLVSSDLLKPRDVSWGVCSSYPTPGSCFAWRDWAINLHPAGRQFMCSETHIPKHSKVGTLRALHGTNRRFPQRDTHKRQTSLGLIPAEFSRVFQNLFQTPADSHVQFTLLRIRNRRSHWTHPRCKACNVFCC